MTHNNPKEDQTDGEGPTSLSPTVTQVIDQLITSMRADDGIAKDSVDRVEKLLRQGRIPKSEELGAALFDPSPAVMNDPH